MIKLVTPMRAEPYNDPELPLPAWAIRDANDQLFCFCFSKETAELLVQIMNGQAGLLYALRFAERELLRLGATDNDDTLGPNEAVQAVKTAIATIGAK